MYFLIQSGEVMSGVKFLWSQLVELFKNKFIMCLYRTSCDQNNCSHSDETTYRVFVIGKVILGKNTDSKFEITVYWLKESSFCVIIGPYLVFTLLVTVVVFCFVEVNDHLLSHGRHGFTFCWEYMTYTIVFVQIENRGLVIPHRVSCNPKVLQIVRSTRRVLA